MMPGIHQIFDLNKQIEQLQAEYVGQDNPPGPSVRVFGAHAPADGADLFRDLGHDMDQLFPVLLLAQV